MNTAAKLKAEKTNEGNSRAPTPWPEKLEGLSDSDLDAVILEAQRLQGARRAAKRDGFLADIRDQAHALGIDPAELAAALGGRGSSTKARAGKRSTVEPKYRNPENVAETWSGRGVKPKWMSALIAKGAKPEDFRIQPAS